MTPTHPHWFAHLLATLARERVSTCVGAASVLGVALYVEEGAPAPSWCRVGDEIRVFATHDSREAQAFALAVFVAGSGTFGRADGWESAFARKLLELLDRAQREESQPVQEGAAF